MTSKDTLLWMGESRLARLVRGEDNQEFDKEGNLFIDFDPKDFFYVLKALRVRRMTEHKTRVPKEAFHDVWNIANWLGLDGHIFASGSKCWSDLFKSLD